MPVLRNARYEQFAHCVARGESPAKAYVSIGYSEKGAHQSSSRLLKVAEVAARVAELRAQMSKTVVEKTGYDFATALTEADAALRMAMEKENPRAAVAAVELKAKLAGLLIDRKEIKTGPLDGIPHDQLREIEAAITAIEAGDAGGDSPAAIH